MSSDRRAKIDAAPYWIGAAAIVLIGMLTFLIWPQRNTRLSVDDRQIEEEWMEGREVVDAFEFFANGGIYANHTVTETADVDQKYVIPLIKRLRDEFGLNVLAIKMKEAPNVAMVIIAESPTDPETRNRVRAAIVETDDAFPGFAYQNWSRSWVSLDFLDERAIPAKTLEKLRQSQRRME